MLERTRREGYFITRRDLAVVAGGVAGAATGVVAGGVTAGLGGRAGA